MRYDEFTDDVTANRLVKAAAVRLGRMRLRSRRSRDGLRWIGARLENVSLVEAYATALALPGGLLIYAQGEAELAAYRVRHAEKRLEIAALDLSGTIDDLLARIGALAQRIRSMRARNPHESGRLIRSTVPAAPCPWQARPFQGSVAPCTKRHPKSDASLRFWPSSCLSGLASS